MPDVMAWRMKQVAYKCLRCESQLVLGIKCLSCGYTNYLEFAHFRNMDLLSLKELQLWMHIEHPMCS